MSFARTYVHTVLVAFDQWGAALLFNRDDITISSLCGLVRRVRKGDRQAANFFVFVMDIHAWQTYFLRGVGSALEYFWPGHCESAIKADTERAKRTQLILGY